MAEFFKMFLEVVFFILLGIAIGFLTGLVPGIHPNTVFAFILSLSVFLVPLSPQALLAFIVSLAISNTFFDFIPSILFGAPEEDSALSILPGHRMLLEGRGYEAIFLTAMGGLGVILLTLLSLPALLFLLPVLYSLIKPVIHLLLLAVVLWMVYKEKRRFIAFSVFLLSGIFGFITLNSFPSDAAMFPAFTGLFGLSTLITSLMAKTRIPPQKISKEVRGDWLKGSVTGWLAGLLSGLLPGLGSSQSGILAAQLLKARIKEFLIALGGINTANMFFTFIVFYVIGKTRSGAVWAISQVMEQLTLDSVCLLVTVGVMTALISSLLTIKAGRLLIGQMKGINYTKITGFTLAALLLLVGLLSGFTGLLVAATGMFLGLLAISTGVKRTHLMGFLVLPTILYFAGLNPFFLDIFW
jgi:putative membrane protein